MPDIDLTPKRLLGINSFKVIQNFITGINEINSDENDDIEIERIRKLHIRIVDKAHSKDMLQLLALINLYSDLAQQSWKIRSRGKSIKFSPPKILETREAKKRKMMVRRDEQLRERRNQAFIRKLEYGHPFMGSRVSIFSLMRDGRELAQGLQGIVNSKKYIFSDLINPYVQFVQRDEICSETGFSLYEIWKYFRLTWSMPSSSIPGRSFSLLIRDRAVKYHPIIGIASLSSASIGLTSRDRFIGWDSEEFLNGCREKPTIKIANWVPKILERLIAGIYKIDFIKDKLIPFPLPSFIELEVIQNLMEVSKKSKDVHHGLVKPSENKTERIHPNAADEEWVHQACTPLFKGKRAGELAKYFALRNLITGHFSDAMGKKALQSLLDTPPGRSAFKQLVKSARTFSVGTEISELSVCGALPPYNELLGGKLVAMLSVSPVIVKAYRRKYKSGASVIASSMAGERVVRSNNLVFIGTTSLYGIRPNQYDRISIPSHLLGGQLGTSVRFHYMDEKTEGIGTFHFSRHTRKAIEAYALSQNNSWKANNVFGEGTSPKLRALRDGINLLGFPSEQLLHHGLPRAVYCVPLVSNLCDYLLGFSKHPKYHLKTKNKLDVEESISKWWFERWVERRIRREEILERIKQHNLIHPIQHGARVKMPIQDID